jgi:hypothetical protein
MLGLCLGSSLAGSMQELPCQLLMQQGESATTFDSFTADCECLMAIRYGCTILFQVTLLIISHGCLFDKIPTGQ